MDSLTQIVLGAACGEAVLGKKIGNKALLFGALGGTIPDLDVFIGNLLYGNKIDAMLFHRGFMHSILFSVLGAFLCGWLVFKLYNFGKRIKTTTQKEWILLFFWSLFTHPILDCFTPYGTQLFAPFSNYRVAFNSIAVVDPLYTLPFLIGMLVLMFFKRSSQKRSRWLRMAISISSVYLLFTLINKVYIDSVFEKSLAENNIVYTRYSTQPTLLNNILWYGIAETETEYQMAFYSLLDAKPRFSEWQKISKTRALSKTGFRDIKRLAWFSKQYYSVERASDNEYLYNDLRYPLMKTKKGYETVFSLQLYIEKNRLNMRDFKPKVEDFGTAMFALWKRLTGV
ncbi:metal-dependent hydrolase [Lacinutrix neustonica]|uniref:Metal-dependent hydrolase n=1 Tax=Lacinutrix neustonica TaxID=2980107 RepID=A0A9E8SEG6_9FLAO|nr:metal-dependent hydrolase [Lacinutrix neustonica]WAC02687.1 metal-dependent hydrolase [Lacinutrix neustonica]